MDEFFNSIWDIIQTIGNIIGMLPGQFLAGVITTLVVIWGIKKLTD